MDVVEGVNDIENHFHYTARRPPVKAQRALTGASKGY
jgi:hypothetical protein